MMADEEGMFDEIVASADGSRVRSFSVLLMEYFLLEKGLEMGRTPSGSSR
jgi:hypothetical protein